MNGYIIRTAYGNRFKTDSDGYVLEYSNGLHKNKDDENRKTWQITGAWKNIGFGHIRMIPLSTLLCHGLDGNLLLTNGLPRYGLTDIDHGTRRRQGNKDGVVGISTY